MKLDRLHEYILPVIVTFLGMLLAAYCGNLSGNGQTKTLVWVVVGVALVAMFLLCRENIWLLVPATFALYGSVPLLPLRFAPRDLSVFFVFVGFLVLKAARVVRYKPKFEAVDWWLFLTLLYLLSVFIRNPVGLEILGTDRVGGRPYFHTFVAVLAYWILARALLAPRHVVLLIVLICLGRISEGMLSFIAIYFPETVPVLSQFYTGIDRSAYDMTDIRAVQMGENTSRQPYLALIGNPIVLALWSFCRPLTVVNPLYIFRFLLLALAFLAIFASGFRSSFAANFAMMYIASYLRRGSREVVRLSLLVFPGLLLLVAGQGTFFDLPLSAQRALSFLPGRWDQVAIDDAKGSTEWRVNMWKATLTEDKYLRNKWLGDGFGFDLRDLSVMAANQVADTPEAQAENQLIVGGVHSGPISAIRYVGIVGLFIFIGLLVVSARMAWKLVRRAEGTAYYPLTLFVGLPLIWNPVNYIFIFGGYDGALPETIFGIGMLKMLAHSLDVHAAQPSPAAGNPPAPRRVPVWEHPPILVGAKRVAGQGS